MFTRGHAFNVNDLWQTLEDMKRAVFLRWKASKQNNLWFNQHQHVLIWYVQRWWILVYSWCFESWPFFVREQTLMSDIVHGQNTYTISNINQSYGIPTRLQTKISYHHKESNKWEGLIFCKLLPSRNLYAWVWFETTCSLTASSKEISPSPRKMINWNCGW